MVRLLNHEIEAMNGIRTVSYADNDGHDLVIKRLQDCSPVLEHNAYLRSLGSAHHKGKDGDYWHYASIPLIVMEQLIEKFGVDVVLNGKDDGRLIREIETNYPYLKTGNWSHSVKSS